MQFELTALVDALPGLGWTALPDGRAEFLNQRWLDYTGLSAEQAAGLGWMEAIHPGDRGNLTAYWQSCVAAGTPGDIEARMRRYDGAYRWFLFRASPVRDATGTISRWLGTNLDIEDRKRTEQALRASELSWRQIVDNIPGLVATMGCGGEVEFLNRQTLEYFGKTSRELQDWSLTESVHPDDLPRVIAARARCIETGDIYQIEHRCRGVDGIYRWFQVRGLPVRDAEGAITTWYLLLTDIEDRKKAEEALRSNERNLNLIINTIPASIHVLGTDGSVLFVNQAVLHYTGLTLEDVQKENYRVRLLHPEDLKRVHEVRLAALKQPVPFELELRTRRGDGSYRWFLTRYSPMLDEQGKLDRWYTASFDIQDRRCALDELQLRVNMFHLIPAAVWSVRPDGTPDIVNQGWYDYTGQTPEYVHSHPEAWMSIMHPDDAQAAGKIYWDGIRSGKDFAMEARFLRARDKTYRWHLNRAVAVRDAAGNIIRFVGTSTDIDDLKAAQEELHKTHAALAHTARVMTMGELMASIAHEINQPLAGIITNVDSCLLMLANDEPNLDRARETLNRTIRDANRAAEVIARLRALFSNKEAAAEPVDLSEAAREVIALCSSDLQRKRVLLRAQLAGDLPLVTGDRVQLQQVILNLITNASDAMLGLECRPRELIVKAELDEDGLVRVTVRDSGTGFDPRNADKLFTSFYSTKPQGMGIGLSVSRSIIQSHRGRIWAAVNEGPGATFSFTIPRRGAC
jgi:PAS domain S-box-containing protein